MRAATGQVDTAGGSQGGGENPASNASLDQGSGSGQPSNVSGQGEDNDAQQGNQDDGVADGEGAMAGAAGAGNLPEEGGINDPPVNDPPVNDPPANDPTAPDTTCPAGAFFCAGFEGTDFPAGTNNVIGGQQFPDTFQLDTSEANSGSQSLFLPALGGGFRYRALAIPAPAQEFWARVFFRTDVTFGNSSHDAILGASDASLTADHNGEVLIELSEQFGYMLTNIDDDTTLQPVVQTELAANQWHCLEAHYDGNSGVVQVFANGTAVIDETRGNAAFQYETFRIGNMQYNTDRAVWFDDVVLAPNRVGCN